MAKIDKGRDKIKDISLIFSPHELRTPLTGVMGYLWLMQKKGGVLNRKQKRYLESALDNGQLLIDLINKRINKS